MYVARFLEKELKKYLDKKEILAVIGPRQCGKTTLLKHIFKELKNALFLDFEDRRTLELFNESIEAFIEIYIKPYDYLFIDEFQYAKDGGRGLKYIYDNYDTKIIISGSSATDLSVQSVKHLVGRIFVFNLYPFSFEEFLNYKDTDLFNKVYLRQDLDKQIINMLIPHFNEFCIYGGYPRVVISDDNEEKETVLRNIYNTYLLKEIRGVLNLPDDHKLSRLIDLLALQTGNMINCNELSEMTDFRYQELLDHLNILEKTFIILRARPFHANKRTELVKTPKIFFLDNGFRNIILNNLMPIEQRPDKGALYENFVATELTKAGIGLRYWRTKSKAEVDFVVEKDGKLVPVEVKSNLKLPKFTRSFHSFLEKYKPEKSLILSESLCDKKQKTYFRPIFSVTKEINYSIKIHNQRCKNGHERKNT